MYNPLLPAKKGRFSSFSWQGARWRGTPPVNWFPDSFPDWFADSLLDSFPDSTLDSHPDSFLEWFFDCYLDSFVEWFLDCYLDSVVEWFLDSHPDSYLEWFLNCYPDSFLKWFLKTSVKTLVYSLARCFWARQPRRPATLRCLTRGWIWIKLPYGQWHCAVPAA